MYKSIVIFLILVITVFTSAAQESADTVDIYNLTLEQLMVIKVFSASKTEQKLSEAPAIMTVITAQQIKERDYKSLAEAVKSSTGLSVWNDNLISSINIRGINSIRGWSQTMKIMIDNQPVSMRFGTTNLIDEEMIPIECVKKIEIIRGPASALYGANAYLGVINIITFQGSEFDAYKLSAEGGSLETYGGTFIAGKKINNIDFMLSVSAKHSDRSGLKLPDPVLTNYINAESENDLSEPKCFYGKISFRNFTLSSNFQKMYRYGEFTDFSVLTHKNLIQMDNWFVKAQYRQILSEKADLKFSTTYGEVGPGKDDHLDVGYPFMWIKRDLGTKFWDFVFESNYSLNEKITFNAGLDYTLDDQKLQDNIYVITDTINPWGADVGDELRQSDLGSKNFNNFGAFIQSIYYPVSKLGLTIGARFDNHNIYGNTFNPRIVGVYIIKKNLSTKLLFGTSFKAPTGRQLFDVSGKSRGNEDLEPQKAQTAEISLNYHKKNFGIKVNFFNNKISKAIQLTTVTDTNLINEGITAMQQNVGNFRTTGVEGEMIIQIGKNLRGYTNISYQNTVNEETNEEAIFVPGITGNLGINYVLMKYININIENIYVGERISPKILDADKYDPEFQPNEEYKIDPYHLMNLTLSTEKIKLLHNKETVLSISCRNLLNQKYTEPGPDNKGYDIQYQGRLFMIKLSQYF